MNPCASVIDESLLQFLYQIPVATFRMSGAGLIDLMSPRAASLLLALGIPFRPGDGWAVLAALDESLVPRVRATLQTPGLVVERHPVERQDPQGRQRHLHVTVIIVEADSCLVSFDDITERIEQERQLGLQRQNMAVVLETIQGYCVVFLTLDLRVMQANRSIERLLGYGADVVGRALSDWIADRSIDKDTLSGLARLAIERGWSAFEAEYMGATGDTLWGDTILTTMRDTGGKAASFVAVVRDISASRRREVELTQQALTDSLTGLLNRRGLAEHVAPWRAAARTGSPRRLSALAVDIDFFKRVNDTHGHAGGDDVLRQVGALLLGQFRSADLVARVGGEEFVVVMHDTSLAMSVVLAERLRQRLETTPIIWHGERIALTVSIGAATMDGADDTERLLRDADLALYRAKSQGRNRVMQA
ncbi:MAG: sensor domain-containing diguanylate cyclase [Aquabacterium sp.]|nr:sensor domain-containing diguanylate cyclase [Aquabacterium sp.]